MSKAKKVASYPTETSNMIMLILLNPDKAGMTLFEILILHTEDI